MAPNRTEEAPRHARSPFFLLSVLVVFGLFLAACEDDTANGDGTGDGDTDTTDSTDATGTAGVDREALLGEVEEVRNLFATQSDLDANLIEDVSYEDGVLTVTLGDDASDETEDTAARADEVCNDLTEAIQLPDLEVIVNGADGSERASCQLE